MKVRKLKSRTQIRYDVSRYCEDLVKSGQWSFADTYCYYEAMHDFLKYVPKMWFGREVDLDAFDGYIPPIFYE